MSLHKITIIKNHQVIRWIMVGLLSGSAVMVAFPVDVVASSLTKILATDSLRAVSFLSRLWLLSAPIGTIVAIIFGNLVLRSSRLTIDTINFLRIAQWAPFLIVWTLAFALTAAWVDRVTWLWLATYCAVVVGLRVAYEYLLVRYFDDLGWKAAIKQIVRPAIMQGLFIALLLEMIVLAELWLPC